MSDVCFPSSSSASHATVSEQLTTTPKATRQRPSLKRIKSCLKHSCPFDSVSSSPTGSGTPERPSTPRKCVAFCSEEEAEVWVADEWDRTPADPARKLSYGYVVHIDPYDAQEKINLPLSKKRSPGAEGHPKLATTRGTTTRSSRQASTTPVAVTLRRRSAPAPTRS